MIGKRVVRAAAATALVRTTMGVALAALLLVTPAAAQAQDDPPCTIICAPELKIEPTFTIEHLAQRPRLEVDGAVERVARETIFELIFALDVPTEIPRIGLTLEAILLPFGEIAVHPFTGAPASAAGRAVDPRQRRRDRVGAQFPSVRHGPDRRLGLVALRHRRQVQSGRDATRRQRVYAQAELRVGHGVSCLQSGAAAPWLRNVELELSLDYLATGLPKAGDVVGDERFLDKASPWSLSFVFVLPLAPLAP